MNCPLYSGALRWRVSRLLHKEVKQLRTSSVEILWYRTAILNISIAMLIITTPWRTLAAFTHAVTSRKKELMLDKASKSLSAEIAREPLRVWDWPVRIFHWSIFSLVIAAYVTSRYNWMTWHVRVGQLILTLLIFRILWGFWGSDTARFRRFLVRPSIALAYTRGFFSHAGPKHIGQPPAGGWMVVALIFVLSMQVLTGLYVYNEVA